MLPRLYRRLLRFYPARFREEYSSGMERQFRDEYREAHTAAGRGALGLHVLGDLLITVPLQRLYEMAADVKHALRIYRSRLASTLIAIAALTLAIGSATGIFSVLNALLLCQLPFRDSGQLVELVFSPMTAMRGRNGFYERARQSAYLAGAATFSSSEMNFMRDLQSYRIKVSETSANLFSLLGVQPALGRAFTPSEDVPGHNAVAVISDSLWRQLYGGDPAALGSSLRLNGNAFTIIGIARARFDYPGGANVWIPTIFDIEKVPKRGAFLFQTVGRLRSGVSPSAAEQMFRAEVQHFDPESLKRDPLNRPRLVSIRAQLAGPVSEASWALAAMALLVVLAACANVAHLLLARVNERRSELAVRAALGASPARLSQQLITEAVLLTGTSAIAGLFVARWVARLARLFVPPALASQTYSVFDWRVISFAAVLALMGGVLLGTLSVLLAGRALSIARRAESDATPLPAHRTHSFLIAIQTGLALVLVFAALMLGRSFLKLSRADLGFRTSDVVTVSASLQGAGFPSAASEWQYYSEALQRLHSVAGVEAAGAVAYLPLAASVYTARSIKLDSGITVERAITNASMPGYFEAIGTRMLAGRDFNFSDGHGNHRSVIVNRAFAQRTGFDMAVLGRHIQAPWTSSPYTVVGIAENERLAGPEYDSTPEIFWPVQEEPGPALTFAARVTGDPSTYLARARDVIRSVNSRVAVFDAKTLADRRDEVLGKPRFYTTATMFLGVLALLLAAAGIYGTALYSIALRRREMGIRMALGASNGKLRATLLRKNLVPVSAGLICGVPAVLASTRLILHLVSAAQGPDPLTVVGAGVILLAVAGIASWRAGAHLLSIDPLAAIRAE